ncbi:MAG TPA: ATP-binding protein [Longimicrobium sp.]|uniref:ATP-binding protein n=1 Tax=Longimicrobium sp. TaxID=2029185 RepID=UPI002ED8A4B2
MTDPEHYRRQLETVAENATLALFIMDDEQRCTYMNRAAEALTGFRLHELQGRALHDCVHHTRPDGTPYPLAECPIDRAFPRNMREQGEEVFVHRDGHFYPVAFTASPIRDGGRTVGTIIEARDISREKRVERRLAFLADLGQALQPITSPDEAVATAARMLGEHLGVDRCAYAEAEADENHFVLTGDYTRGDTVSIVGRYAMSDFGAETLRMMRADLPYVVDDAFSDPRVTEADRAAYVQTQIVAVICMPLHKAGRFRAAMAVHQRTPRHWLDDEVELVRTVTQRCWESIERARALRGLQGALREAERARDRAERLQALTAALAGARTLDDVATVVVADMVVALGARTGALAGRAPEGDALVLLRTVGFPEPVAEGVQRQTLDYRSPLTECFRTRSPVWLETREGPEGLDARFPPIAPVWDRLGVASAVFVPLTAAGEAVGVISFAFSAPRTFPPEERAFLLALGQQSALAVERARLFQAEHAARSEAERANLAKSEFLAVMSHELRTPLNAIGGYAELMEMGIRGPITPQQREDLRRVQTSQRHLLGLINEVLNYARLETGAVHYDLADVPLREALLAAEALVAPQAQARKLALSVEPCPPTLAARADAEKVRQILVNLLSNAVKFTDPGGRVELSCAQSAGRVQVVVRDTGIGIAADQLGRIFEPFVQVRADLTRTAEGTGLGLAISRDLARGMGGDLTAASTPGAGSAFTLTLPAA